MVEKEYARMPKEGVSLFYTTWATFIICFTQNLTTYLFNRVLAFLYSIFDVHLDLR